LKSHSPFRNFINIVSFDLVQRVDEYLSISLSIESPT
jgi:hypothetical protein